MTMTKKRLADDIRITEIHRLWETPDDEVIEQHLGDDLNWQAVTAIIGWHDVKTVRDFMPLYLGVVAEIEEREKRLRVMGTPQSRFLN